MKKATSFISLSILALLLLGGCSTAVMDIDGSSEGEATINQKNSPVAIKVLNAKSRFVNGLLTVSMQFESGISNPYTIEYKMSWFDADGFEVDSESGAWTPIYLQGRETKTVQTLAPNPSVRSYKIKIREADDSDSLFKWEMKPLF